METPEPGRGLGSVVQRLCSRLLPLRPEFESSSAGKRKRTTRRTCATRRTAVAVTGRAAAGVPCLVPRFCVCQGARGWGRGHEKDGGDTPPDAPAVPMVERDAEGGGGGGLTDGPLDGQTNRGSNPRPRRAPAIAHTTRPSIPLTRIGAKIV